MDNLKDKTTDIPGLLPYPHHVGSALINPDATSSFVNRAVTKVNHEFEERYSKLKNEYDSLIEEWKWNKIIWESDIKFEPVIGQVYHLYQKDEKKFISIVAPDEWNLECLGSFKFGAGLKWEKI